MLHISQVDAVLESDRYPCVLPSEIPDEADRQLGQVVAGLVEDGDTIQLGFGGTINALASELKGKRHLGIHTEALSDAGMELLRSGAADNSRKTLHPGRTVTCFTMGSQALYDFIDDNPAFLHKTLSYTNNPSVLAAHPGMTSINAALQIDLTGQCASEGLGTRHISGSGGQVDTSVGAQMAPGGKSIITLALHLSVPGPQYRGDPHPIPHPARPSAGSGCDPDPYEYTLRGHRVWRSVPAGADHPAAGACPYPHCPPRLPPLVGGRL